MRDVIGYWGDAVMARGPLEGVLLVVAALSTAACWGLLLAGAGGVWAVLTALYGTVVLTAAVARAWPPVCGCGVRHWDADDGDDQDDEDGGRAEYGRAA